MRSKVKFCRLSFAGLLGCFLGIATTTGRRVRRWASIRGPPAGRSLAFVQGLWAAELLQLFLPSCLWSWLAFPSPPPLPTPHPLSCTVLGLLGLVLASALLNDVFFFFFFFVVFFFFLTCSSAPFQSVVIRHVSERAERQLDMLHFCVCEL